MNDEIMLLPMRSAQVSVMRDDPDTVVLRLGYGDGERLALMMTRKHFAELARQLVQDAVLLAEEAPAGKAS